MIESVRQLYAMLSPSEKRGALKLLFLMGALALLEATGVASIMPFLAILSSPDLIESNSALATLSAWTGVTSADQLLLLTGALVFCPGRLGFGLAGARRLGAGSVRRGFDALLELPNRGDLSAAAL